MRDGGTGRLGRAGEARRSEKVRAMQHPSISILFLATAAVAAGATFGTVAPITGGATDLVLDEGRGRLYVVNSTQNRIDVYSTSQRRFLNPIPTSPFPLAAAISRSGASLYVTSYTGSSLDVVDLESMSVARRVILPASPEGVAVGADERVLITTIGSGTGNADNRLLLYDPNSAGSLRAVTTTLPAPAPPQAPAPSNQIFMSSRSHLMATPDGQWIVGLNNPNNTSRLVFVFEVASGTVLRSRTVTSISSVLSVAPDGSRFMAGLSLFDTATLAIVAQQNAANALYPFQQNVNFNTQQNQGGSLFSPDGSVLYSAFNIAPVQNPAARANSSQFMLSDPDNLLITEALQLPEDLTGKIVIDSSGSVAYALSQSGFLILPVGSIYSNPIAQVDSVVAVVANDQCGVTSDSRTYRVTVRNRGQGRMSATAQVMQTGPTFTFPIAGQPGAGTPGAGGAGGGAGGGAPGGGVIIVLPGDGQTITVPPGAVPGAGGNLAATTTQQNAVGNAAPQVTVRQTGNGATFDFTFNASSARSLGTPTPIDFLVQSPEAINIPARVRVYQNNRNAEAPGTVVPVPVSVSTGEGLVDMVLDSLRQKIYIANSGLNRVEVFDIRSNQLLAPIKVGQLPRSLALSPNGSLLYVANTGGESISIIDLDQGAVTGKVTFPPVPYNASFALNTPSIIAAGLSGLQIMMSNGALWKAVDNEAVPRSASTAIGSATIPAPRTMVATPDGEYIMLLGGTGMAYLYDASSDEWVLGQQVVTTPIQGYYGPVAAGPRGQYYVVNGTILNASLTPISSATAPGSNTVRPISAVTAMNATTIARFVQPTRSAANSVVTDPPTVELVDANTGTPRGQAMPALEGPLSTQVGTQRVNVGARMMAVDPAGTTVYLLTTSGLTIVPLAAPGPQNRVSVNPNGVVNGASYQTNLAPGSIVSLFGQNVASDAAVSGTLPAVLGGTCVTIDNRAVPLVMTSGGQINLQIPPDMSAGRHALVARSIDRKAASASQTITVSKYAPAVYLADDSGSAAVFRFSGELISKSSKARRDEPLMLFATGLGVTQGGKVTAGNAAPSDPLATTDKVQVFFGDPRIKEAEVIVDWSGLVPGFVGLYQLNLRIPGAHLKGDALPVTLRIGGVDSPTTGKVVPVVAVE